MTYHADAQYFPTPLQRFQHLDKYARWRDDLGRRETWVETVDRAVDYLRELGGPAIDEKDYAEIRGAILNMDVVPSMRLLSMAGEAARRQNLAIYNCAAVAVDDIYAFVEALIVSMAGGGMGYSVERRFVDKLREVLPQQPEPRPTVVFEDSAEGWAEGLKQCLVYWWTGSDPQCDLTKIRPAGAILTVKGGRASGPEPLERMLLAIRQIILGAQGRKLRPIEAHDIMCHVGSAAVSGGVRRTAMLALFDKDDEEMLAAKAGEFWTENPQRTNANNSAVWEQLTPDRAEFDRVFDQMVENGTGEPGFINRAAMRNLRPKRRKDAEFLVNPCAEIALRSQQLCNLSAVVARADDDPGDLYRKIRVAAMIGTIQAKADHFPGMRPQWKKNQKEERLLGVDITGQMDCPRLRNNAQLLDGLMQVARYTNKRYAKILGIAPAAAVTCVKPSGNTSVLVDCSSGLHPRWAPFYVRRVRLDAKNPIYPVLRDAGVPMFPEVGQEVDTRTWVAEFPIKAPEGAVTRNDMSAIDQCEVWLSNRRHYTEHSPSVTVTYTKDEVPALKDWVYDHFNVLSGMSFLPKFEGSYPLLPYEEITQEEYEQRVRDFPDIDWDKLQEYELSDRTTSSQELACVAGLCEV